MTFGKLFKKKQSNKEKTRQYIKSKTDLKLLPEQILYVEDVYNRQVNKIISKNYDEICNKFKLAKSLTEFIYLPIVSEQLQSSSSLSYILKYYFPSIDEGSNLQVTPATFQTGYISHILFSLIAYKAQINPGFFRYVGKDNENLFVYEYFSLKSPYKFSLLKRIYDYANSISEKHDFNGLSSPLEDEDIFFDDVYNSEDKFPVISNDNAPEISLLLESYYDEKPKEKKVVDIPLEESKQLRKMEFFPQAPTKKTSRICYSISEKQKVAETNYCKEHELIKQMKSDILNLKELGFYELLIKEIGGALFENDTNKMFQPSRLFMDDEFRIYLPDFDNIEIAMTPLPKTLFILFLRHPEGINLKSLIDYKKELLETYKLLSYREAYFNMVESVNRICNPFEGSINEKLSRIKEAFLKKMSMDTAKYYIVTGERGMKKRIEINRSLIELPKAFEELELTKAKE